MSNKRPVDRDLANMLTDFPAKDLISFLNDIMPLFELYDVEDDNDWVEEEVGKEATNNVRVIRTFYLMSKIADNHAGMLVRIKTKYKGLWERMEKESKLAAEMPCHVEKT